MAHAAPTRSRSTMLPLILLLAALALALAPARPAMAATAAAILQLQEQGKLSVQDPIYRHLPAWPKATGDRATFHQLLSHTAGIPNYTDDAAVMARRTVEMTLDELCATFRDKPLDFEPGTSWSYINSGYVILGLVIEAVTGPR